MTIGQTIKKEALAGTKEIGAETMSLLKIIGGNDNTEKVGAAGMAASIGYGILSGDIVGAAIGTVGAAAARFHKYLDKAVIKANEVDVTDLAKKICAKVAAKKTEENAGVFPVLTKYIPDEDVQQRMEAAIKAKEGGKATEEDDLWVAMVKILGK